MRQVAVVTSPVIYSVSAGRKCCGHNGCAGMVMTGDPFVRNNGLSVARTGDLVSLFGPHVPIATIIGTGFPISNGPNVACVTDIVVGPGVFGLIVSSPSNIFTE